MTTLWEQIQSLGLTKALLGGKYGVEIEEHRVTTAGRLSRLPYPESFGDRRFHPYLQTDYSETQQELVTEPAASFEEARDNLMRLQLIFRDELDAGEGIWPLSMPPRLDASDLAWVDETFGRPWYQDYRDWLKQKYGSTHEIITGMHVNFSLSEELLQGLFDASDEMDYIAFKNARYFRLAQGIAAHRWLFVYLFGATPFNLNATDSRIPEIDHPVRSIRGSQFGFANDSDVVISYDTNLDDHIEQVKSAVQGKQLYSNHEFYGSIRFKGNDDLEALSRDGVRYLEMRVLDNDPFDPAGISENALNIIQLIIMWILVSDKTYSPEELAARNRLANEVALQNPTDKLPNLDEAKQLMAEVSKLADSFGMRFNDGLSLIAERILNPAKTPAARLVAVAPTADDMQAWGTTEVVEQQAMFHVKHDELFDEYFGDTPLREVAIEAIKLGVQVLKYRRDELLLAVGNHQETVTEPVSVAKLFPEI